MTPTQSSRQMTPPLSELIRTTAPLLQPKKIVCDADRDLGFFETQTILAHILNVDRIWLTTHSEYQLTKKQLQQFNKLIKRRQKHEPIAYLFGTKEFYGRNFLVNKYTLIPRPETELLIDLVKQHINRSIFPKPTSIWDVGTGSGIIAITLAHEIPSAKILATDISTRALTIAKKNAKQQKVHSRINFLKQNLVQPQAFRWLKQHAKREQSELFIVANLPYLPLSDKRKLEPDVIRFEPASALFAKEQGLGLIKQFLGQISRHAEEWGYTKIHLFFEYDPPQTPELVELIQKLFPKTKPRIERDLAGRDRVCHFEISPLI